MIFVSAPYLDFYKEIVEQRTKAVSIYCAHLLQKELVSVSPILMVHKILEHINFDTNFDYWKNLNLKCLSISDEIHVLILSGWKQSLGVQTVIEKAKELNIPIKYFGLFIQDNGTYSFVENMTLKNNDEYEKKLKAAAKEFKSKNKKLFTNGKG